MQQPETQAPEDTDTSKIDGTAHGSGYGNTDAATLYKNGQGTTGASSAPPTGTPISDSHASGPVGSGIVDSGAQGAEPVQNTTKPCLLSR